SYRRADRTFRRTRFGFSGRGAPSFASASIKTGLAPSLALFIVLRVLFSFGGVDFMATTTRSREIDPELMTSRMFAQVFQAYVECTEEIQSLIRDMVEIVNDSSATEDEKLMACSTIAESLFPSRHGGQLGVDLEQFERLDAERSREIKDVHASMDRQEEHFADRVLALMPERDMTQAQLANACKIGQ